jgi:hypothetical protein
MFGHGSRVRTLELARRADALSPRLFHLAARRSNRARLVGVLWVMHASDGESGAKKSACHAGAHG